MHQLSSQTNDQQPDSGKDRYFISFLLFSYTSFIAGVQRSSQESERPRDRTERHTNLLLPGRPGCGAVDLVLLKQNEAQSARAESTHKGVHLRSKFVTQVRQQRP